MTRPSQCYWVNDEMGIEWRVLIEGDYETYPDGFSQVVDLEVISYTKITVDENILVETVVTNPNYVPQEIVDFAETLCEDTQTYKDVQESYEEELR
jgi:hypothetical protein